MSLDLYQLLPAYVRSRDAEQGHQLEALLSVISEQVGILKRDIDGLSDDLFVETCAPWVLPYLGRLVGNKTLHDVSDRAVDTATQRLVHELGLRGPDLRPPLAIRRRADVAKTIYYRRRKSTPTMLEEIARDVTGWGARLVEFFQRLVWSQHLDHLRMDGTGTAMLRTVEVADRVGGPFDAYAHNVDVRPIAQTEGWHHVPNVGFFVWRLRSLGLSKVPARQASESWRYHFSPLGNPTPLFVRVPDDTDNEARTTELTVPAPIRRALWFDDLQRYAAAGEERGEQTNLYGPDRSFAIEANGASVLPAADVEAPADAFTPRIVCRRLEPWPALQPTGFVLAVDVANGRLAVGDGWPAISSLDVSFHHGFPAALGGGSYDRSKWIQTSSVELDEQVADSAGLDAALALWHATTPATGRITIVNSGTYHLSTTTITLPDAGSLVIQAANGERPLLITDATRGLEVDVTVDSGSDDRQASFTLSGLVVEGFVHVVGDLGKLRVLHSTLIPGRSLTEDGLPGSTEPSLVVDESAGGAVINAQLECDLVFSITGPLRVPAGVAVLWILDTIVDGLGAVPALEAPSGGEAGATSIERSTILGSSHVRTLSASETLFDEPIVAEHRQDGCVRFSSLPDGSLTPRRYECQPDVVIADRIAEAEAEAGAALVEAEKAAIREEVRSWLVPSYTSTRYGHPAYLQLRRSSPVELREGAEDGSEMGAYSHLKTPQRATNLAVRIDEYLPVGLVPGILYVT
ncbi:MAG: hypothetical protein AAF628_19355 [Planctomycetota bacterium]